MNFFRGEAQTGAYLNRLARETRDRNILDLYTFPNNDFSYSLLRSMRQGQGAPFRSEYPTSRQLDIFLPSRGYPSKHTTATSSTAYPGGQQSSSSSSSSALAPQSWPSPPPGDGRPRIILEKGLYPSQMRNRQQLTDFYNNMARAVGEGLIPYDAKDHAYTIAQLQKEIDSLKSQYKITYIRMGK